MRQPVVRVPIIEWRDGFARRWNDGDACATHAFNALSFLFPHGEAFFVEVARDVRRRTDLRGNDELASAVRAFIAQESLHGREHQRYNAVLEQQGFRNVAKRWIELLLRHGWRRYSPLTRLAIVCAYEHYTAVLGAYLLDHPRVLANAPPDLALVWGWHAAEETEHKAVCFDLYRAAGGGYARRVTAHLWVSLNFAFMFAWLLTHLLARDDCLKWRNLATTLREGARFFWGRSGAAWAVLRGALRYWHPRFHPWNADNRTALQAWLAANSARLRAID
jgi:predicted metal-dependent hydrolase